MWGIFRVIRGVSAFMMGTSTGHFQQAKETNAKGGLEDHGKKRLSVTWETTNFGVRSFNLIPMMAW